MTHFVILILAVITSFCAEAKQESLFVSNNFLLAFQCFPIAASSKHFAVGLGSNIIE